MLDPQTSASSRPGLRLRVTGLVVVALFGLLGLRLWTLQVLQSPAATQAVTANQIRVVTVAPTRGLILDRYGNPLVDNLAVNEITVSRSAVAADPSVVGRLAALTGQTTARVQGLIADPRTSVYAPVPVLLDAPLSVILYIKEHAGEFPGVATVQTSQRNYPQQEPPQPASVYPLGAYPASQVLGYVGTINGAELAASASGGYRPGDAFGQAGLEFAYERVLRGTPGSQQLEVDALGQVVGTVRSTPAVPGDNLVTNIDTGLQQVADNALASQIATLRRTYDPACNGNRGCYPGATSGSVVVLDPTTGAVLALSSYPTYNPSIWVGGISTVDYAVLSDPNSNAPLIDRGIAGVYTPGSTFKLATATAALDRGLPAGSQYYDDTGTFTIPNCTAGLCTLHNADSSALGEISMPLAIAASDDAFFYNLGYQFYAASGTYGQTPIQDVAGQYGLGQLTGVDLPGEVAGRVDSQAERLKLHGLAPNAFPTTSWYAGDNVEMAFGQGATVVTPLEEAVAYSTFANGGTRYAPQVVAAVVTPSGRVVKRFTPQVTGHVAVPPGTEGPLLAGFQGAVNDPLGTAYPSFRGSLYPAADLAGKTGTADTVPGKEPTGWFVGFTTTGPRYVVVCVIDEAGYGTSTGAPVVRRVFDYLWNHPVTAPAIPPASSIVQQTAPLPLPASTTPASTTPASATPASATPAQASAG